MTEQVTRHGVKICISILYFFYYPDSSLFPKVTTGIFTHLSAFVQWVSRAQPQ